MATDKDAWDTESPSVTGLHVCLYVHGRHSDDTQQKENWKGARVCRETKSEDEEPYLHATPRDIRQRNTAPVASSAIGTPALRCGETARRHCARCVAHCRSSDARRRSVGACTGGETDVRPRLRPIGGSPCHRGVAGHAGARGGRSRVARGTATAPCAIVNTRRPMGSRTTTEGTPGYTEEPSCLHDLILVSKIES